MILILPDADLARKKQYCLAPDLNPLAKGFAPK